MAGGNPVLILTGPPGAGKTTVARALAARFERAAHVESDRFFHFIESGYVEPWQPESHQQNTVVMGIVAEAASGYAAAGYFTIVDGIVIPRFFLEPLRRALQAEGHAVAYAVLRAPLDVCLARAADRERVVVEQMWHQFEDLGPFKRHAVAAAAASPDEIAASLEQDLRRLQLG